MVEFPIEGLDLTDMLLSRDPVVYDLIAVGTVYAKNFNTGTGQNFDDLHVRSVEVSSVKTAAANLLFYHRCRATTPPAARLLFQLPTPLQVSALEGGVH
ncbi:hypothetical protein BC936DRAFT_144848 [Jimgerdemannia flammicorona]|uniref:Uncharacterized protein n=1 Tax=Jimgerdemannia flammicorona TaxID=994334 RepID=A0A433DBH7_9FUNG|nr:hypothetical protein BC936DRAFT_144848 [Jimgerdemannia flammicorona]